MPRADEAIKQDILDEMYWDSRVDSADVKVEVNEGQVTLTGTVSSYTARIAAENDSWIIRDVREVENRLSVQFPETFEVPSDDEIRSNARRALAWNQDVYSLDILVSAAAGVVTLEGTVDSYWKRWKAEDLVAELRGVIDVENRLSVVPGDEFSDKEIARDIQQALYRNVHIDAENITVKVEDGRATLTGTVPNYYSRNNAYTSAAFTPGVTEVKNEVVII